MFDQHQIINRDRATKVVAIRVTKTIESCAFIEVPIDVAEDDVDDIYDIARCVQINGFDEYDIDKYDWDGSLQEWFEEDEDEPACARVVKRDGRWRLLFEAHGGRLLRDRAATHSKLVRQLKSGEDVEYNLVDVEFPTGEIVPGMIYYRKGYSLVLAFRTCGCMLSKLEGHERCYPVEEDTRLVPIMATIGLGDDFGDDVYVPDVAKVFAQIEQQLTEQPTVKLTSQPGCVLVHPKPRTAQDPDELYSELNARS